MLQSCLLLETADTINAQDKSRRDQRTVLMSLCAEKMVEAAGRAVDLGADIDIQDSDGWTALHYAASLNQYTVVAKLLEQGADTDLVNSDGDTPLSLAILEGYTECIELLRYA